MASSEWAGSASQLQRRVHGWAPAKIDFEAMRAREMPLIAMTLAQPDNARFLLVRRIFPSTGSVIMLKTRHDGTAVNKISCINDWWLKRDVLPSHALNRLQSTSTDFDIFLRNINIVIIISARITGGRGDVPPLRLHVPATGCTPGIPEGDSIYTWHWHSNHSISNLHTWIHVWL